MSISSPRRSVKLGTSADRLPRHSSISTDFTPGAAVSPLALAHGADHYSLLAARCSLPITIVLISTGLLTIVCSSLFSADRYSVPLTTHSLHTHYSLTTHYSRWFATRTCLKRVAM